VKLSVIIPTFNRRALLEETLPTVLDQTFPAGEYEVIVVVDGSVDGTAAWLRELESPVSLRVVEQENRGQAAARNAGVRLAEGELVLFLDDDIFCERNLVAAHVGAHVDGDSLVFGPILVAPQSPETLATTYLRISGDENHERLRREGVTWPADACVDPNTSLRREAVLRAGGFDERFFRARENWDLGLRLWQAGVRFRFCPEAVTYHLYVKTTDDLVLGDAPLYGAHEVLLCRKHPAYRRRSSFAQFQQGSWLKRKARELAVRLPFSLDRLLRVLERGARGTRQRGLRIFNVRWQLALYRTLLQASGGWAGFQREVKPLPVLMYHRVGPDRPGTHPGLNVPPDRFRRQIRWLVRRGYTTIRTEDWFAYCTEGKPLPEKPVLVTFDDAYADLAEHALPVLREHRATATVFVVTGEVGGSNSWDRDCSAELRCMSADEIRRWSREGIEFGAHSRTHADLARSSDAQLETEVLGSKGDLAALLGRAPLSFAYPFGSFNDAACAAVQRGFPVAFTSEEGPNGLATELHLLRRTMVQPGDTLLDLSLRVRFGWNPLEHLRTRVRVRTRLRALFGAADRVDGSVSHRPSA
jgi:GT2 family glycosyltransferase/peptidoglycan/xylan/chitin deacetylase (PgdA/CDA1 family)